MATDGADSRISTIAEMADDSALAIDFQGMAEKVAAATKKNVAPMVEQSSILRQLWMGVVEDFRGQPARATA